MDIAIVILGLEAGDPSLSRTRNATNAMRDKAITREASD